MTAHRAFMKWLESFFVRTMNRLPMVTAVWCKYSSRPQMTVHRAFLEWSERGRPNKQTGADCRVSRRETGQEWRFSADADTTGRRNGFCHSAGRGRMRGEIVRRPCANSFSRENRTSFCVRLCALSSSTATGQDVLAGLPHILDQFHGGKRRRVAPLGENPLHGKVLRRAGKRHRERAAVRREPLP